jgi:hypothetical protein
MLLLVFYVVMCCRCRYTVIAAKELVASSSQVAGEDLELEAEFKVAAPPLLSLRFLLLLTAPHQPNILNSVMFLVAVSIQNITFAINYQVPSSSPPQRLRRRADSFQGRPFVASIFEYRALLYAVLFSFLVTLAVMFELSSTLNSLLQFSPFPSAEFRTSLVKIIFADVVATVAVETATHRLLYKVPPLSASCFIVQAPLTPRFFSFCVSNISE